MLNNVQIRTGGGKTRVCENTSIPPPYSKNLKRGIYMGHITVDQLTKRIKKITGKSTAESHGAMVSFYDDERVTFLGRRNRYPDYTDEEIKNRLKKCGYL